MIALGEQLTSGEFCFSGRLERNFLRLGIMFEEENDLDCNDRIVECPYDSSHQVCLSRMARHLGKCRENFNVSEKAICPFNKNHTVYVPELNYHKQTCPNKAEDFQVESDENQATSEQKENGAISEPQVKENGSGFDSYFASDIESTGCVNGRPEGGGIHNHCSVKQQNDETTCDTPTQKADSASEEVNGRCEIVVEDSETSNSVVVGEQPPNHSAAIERQFSQSESDTASSESELSTSEAGNVPESFDQTTQVVHFDYKKFAPSPEEKEEFLKLISQSKENRSCMHEKYQVVLNQTYGPPQWNQGYGAYAPQPFSVPSTGYHTGAMPHAYVTFTNGYPMMPPVPGQPPYGPYVFPQPVQGNGGFIPGPSHGVNFDYGENYHHRPHYHRPYKRRGYPGSYSHQRYNNNNNNYHSYNSYNGHNSTDTDSNSTTSSTPSDSGSVEENGCSLKIDGLTPVYDEQTVDGGNMKKNSTKQHNHHLPAVSSKNGVKVEKAKVNFEQFVKIEKVAAGKQLNGKIQHVEVIPYNHQADHNTANEDGTKSGKDKQIRKLRKKLNEVLSLEEKKLGGAKLDCDQLKKLTRKREIEDQLAILQIN